MNILGIVAHTLGYGDACAALSVGGKVVGVVEEERFSRIRYDDTFPRQAIRTLLQTAGIRGADVDVVALHMNPWRGLGTRLYWAGRHPLATLTSAGDYLRGYGQYRNLRGELGEALESDRFAIEYYPHHHCHAAAAFYTSPFDRAACLSLDGAGEGLTGLIAVAHKGQPLKELRRFKYPHSLGMVYSAVCHHIGFPAPAGPGKVMGLAPYGNPTRHLDLFRKAICVRNGSLEVDLRYFVYHKNLVTPRTDKPWVSDKFIDGCGLARRRKDDPLEQTHIDLAAALQARTNEIGVELARQAAALTGERNLCLSGGVALNSVMNGAIAEDGAFDAVYVQPAAGDAGNSLGAVVLASLRRGLPPPQFAALPFAGPEFSDREIHQALQRCGVSFRPSADIGLEAAQAIRQGLIVGWFQGRMEYGPRALGGRSILADPQRPDMRDIINHKVKHREWFRPFAPSVTEDACSRYFTGPGRNPYMLIVARVRDPWRSVFPSITHVDGTARVQSVCRADNPAYYGMLNHLESVHGHPVVLNTSFNDKAPIVCSPDDAIACFQGTQIDRLCIGNFYCEKVESGLRRAAA